MPGYYLYVPSTLFPRKEVPILNLYIGHSENFHMRSFLNTFLTLTFNPFMREKTHRRLSIPYTELDFIWHVKFHNLSRLLSKSKLKSLSSARHIHARTTPSNITYKKKKYSTSSRILRNRSFTKYSRREYWKFLWGSLMWTTDNVTQCNANPGIGTPILITLGTVSHYVPTSTAKISSISLHFLMS
jgi:hypothetical protein